jgi:hypothetical protein
MTVEPEVATLGLPARPEIPAAELAAIVAAVVAMGGATPAPGASDAVQLAWRFSGRWWHAPTVLRRERPWARR